MADSIEMRALTHARLAKRKEHMLALFDRVAREIDAGKHDGSEDGRLWLEQFCAGKGVQVCSGEFSIGDSIGVNNDPRAVATDHWCFADRFTADLGPLDYLVSNYIEAFADPLRVLQDWCGRMKPGGVVALVCRNSDAYPNADGDLRGPLCNKRRASCFTLSTIKFYLERAGFTVTQAAACGKELRIAAKRR